MPSIPGVFFPRFEVTRLTAINLAAFERRRSRCNPRTLLLSPASTAFTIRACNRFTIRMTSFHITEFHFSASPGRPSTACGRRLTVLSRFIFPILSRDSRPAGSLHPFGSGLIQNPCPPHYKTAFAFSGLLCLLVCRLPLRVGFRRCGDNQVYHVPLISHDDSGSACPPGELKIAQSETRAL